VVGAQQYHLLTAQDGFGPDRMQDSTRWLIKRNCSASPAFLAFVFASMVGVSFVFGLAFALRGLWGILPFVGLELVAVAAAFVCYGRHANDYERIELGAQVVEIERVEAARSTVMTLTRPWARVELEEPQSGWRGKVRVFLAAGGERVEVGRLLAEDRRAALARELRLALRTPAAV
jgi:uncharacterized membrane protein